MPKLKSYLQERKEREAAIAAGYQASLSNTKKKLAGEREFKKQKKKDASVLMSSLDIAGIESFAIRAPEDYTAKSYNYHKQVVGLVNHMFVKYPIPLFMYDAVMTHTKVSRRDDFKLWFVALAQGHSFPKLVKGVMSRAEAAQFLRAPDCYSMEQNIWWARMAAAGVPPPVAHYLMDKMLGRMSPFPDWNAERMADVIRFFARYHQELDRTTMDEICDFLNWKLRNDPDFSMKGRTANSVIQLSNEWHVLIQKAKLGADVSWPGLMVADWQHVDKSLVWTVRELRNNKELMNEGRKLRHCVYSYVSRCSSGLSSIFSMRYYQKVSFRQDELGEPIYETSGVYETGRITIEVSASSRSVVQVRGLSNRQATEQERQMLRMWAGEKGFTVSRYF